MSEMSEDDHKEDEHLYREMRAEQWGVVSFVFTQFCDSFEYTRNKAEMNTTPKIL